MGGRSRVAAQMLAGKGFKQVYNVSGGIKAWKNKTAVGPQALGMALFDGDESVEMILGTAYSLEQGLHDFYVEMAGQSAEPRVSALFRKLAEIEIHHQESIYTAYARMADEPLSREAFGSSVQSRALEGGMTTQDYLDLFQPDLSVEAEVISLAMSIEAQALDLYQRVGNRVTNSDSRTMIFKIADEEKAHLASLGKLMDEL